MAFVVFAENKVIAICDSLSNAVKSIPKNTNTHILNEEEGEVLFFKKGKLDGKPKNR
jgi:hypothetical protein